MPERKKPTGRSGIFRVFGDGHGGPLENPLPANKAEIEKMIVDIFLRSHTYFTGEPFFLSNPRQNPEQDFDFTVTSPKGDAFLELMEIAPLAQTKGDYEKLPAGQRAGEIVTAIQIFKSHVVTDQSASFFSWFTGRTGRFRWAIQRLRCSGINSQNVSMLLMPSSI